MFSDSVLNPFDRRMFWWIIADINALREIYEVKAVRIQTPNLPLNRARALSAMLIIIVEMLDELYLDLYYLVLCSKAEQHWPVVLELIFGKIS